MADALPMRRARGDFAAVTNGGSPRSAERVDGAPYATYSTYAVAVAWAHCQT